jgi:hypothetical protein
MQVTNNTFAVILFMVRDDANVQSSGTRDQMT